MTRIERRVFRNSVLIGLLVTLCVLLAQVLGWLQAPENWLYDWRARRFQFKTEKPSSALVHLDIDDRALEGIGRWPWPRSEMAEMIDEIRLAGAKAIGLDIIYPDPQLVDHEIIKQPDGTEVIAGTIDHDGLLAASIRRMGNVIVPASVPLRGATGDPFERAVIEQLAADLELSDTELAARLKAEGFRDEDVDARAKAMLIPLRREAAYRRIRRETASKDLTVDQVRALILHRTDVNIASPLIRVIDEQYGRYMQVRSALALGGPIPKSGARLAETDIYLAPVARLSANAAASAFVDFQPSGDGILRSVPLLVDCEGRLFPHLGLSLALLYLGVNPADLQFTGSAVIIPQPGGKSINVPVRTFRSDALARDIPATLDVPWFGTSNWQTMYDWPAHKATSQHVTMNLVWEPCLIRRKIIKNNRTLDRRLSLFNEALGMDAKWSALAEDDFTGRLARIDQVYAHDFYKPSLEQAESIPVKDRDKNSTEFLAAVEDLKTIRRENEAQLALLGSQRAKVKSELNGKAVLIGFTATGNEDSVATSIHGRCPGVIAHGVVFNSIVTGQFWASSPRWVNYLVTVVLGVLTALIAGRLGWAWAFLVVSAMGGAFLLFNCLYLFDNHNILLDLAAPQIAMGGVWSACSLVRIYLETIDRKRVERQFRSYVDPDVVTAAMERGAAATAGESRELTVAFSDLAGFTTLSEQLGEKTVPMLNDYLDRMVPLIAARHGIMKFLGDGIMFFYGSPKPNPDHAADAVLTALEMQAKLVEFNEELKAKGYSPLGMRIGVNTGLMVVGDAGSKDPTRHEYTVLGNEVNFASRLEGANKYVGTSILISARTAQLCGNKFLLQPVGALQVVGKTEAVLTFAVCGLADTANDKQKNLCEDTRTVIEHFRERKFETVLKLIDQHNKTHGPSPLTAIYRDLSESYLLNPPEPTFDGRIEFDKK